jgi:hypothetical protein
MVNTDENPRFLDYNLPLEKRIEDLISRLTLDEKISQFLNNAMSIDSLNIPNTIGGMKLSMALDLQVLRQFSRKL